jgi:iron uptake system EfeUOB component EfeO/EfeM
MRSAAVVLGVAVGVIAAGCGSSSSTSANGETQARTVSVSLTDAGCDPSSITIPSGSVTFEVENKGASAVTEFEVLEGKRILGEVENLADGFSGDVSLTLEPGTYELYCPNGTTAEHGTLTVTKTS